ncbi:MAG TPA: SusF/SusE family outer membrane protein [Puia sp.]|nr:SusF/SusE family outer membrane protein [Puia sp.]
MRLSVSIKNIRDHKHRNLFITAFTVGMVSLLSFNSCKKFENFASQDLNGPLAVSVSDPTVVLNEANANATALTFNWTTGSNHTSGSSISYVLQLDKQGNNFSAPLTNNLGTAIYTVAYTTAALNTLGLTYWNTPPGQALNLQARVYTILGDGTAPGDTSDATSFSITPYEPVSKTLYIIGSATAAGWDAGTADSLTPDPAVPGEFHYTGTLTPGEFKFVTTRAATLLPSYNKGADTAHLVYRTADDQPDDRFTVTNPDVYTIDVNLVALTIKVSKVEAPLYSKLWIVGDATPNGWNIDNPNEMKVDVFNPYVFHYNEVLNVGEFKMPTTTGNWGADFYRPLTNHPPITDTTAALVLGNTNPPDNKWQISTAGPYKISLNIMYNSIHITPFTPYTALWLLGDAAPNGWDDNNPTPMTATADPNVFVYEGPLTAGEFKIPVAIANGFAGPYFRPAVNHPPITDTNAPFVPQTAAPADTQDFKWQITEAGTYKITLNQLYETISIVKE